MCEQNIEDLAVGPYVIDTRERVITEMSVREGQPRINSFKCRKGSQVLTAKCIERDVIGTAAKRKGHQKWQAQLKTVTDICSVDSQHMIATFEVVRTSQSYWMFQDYDSERVIPLGDFLRIKSQETNGTAQATFLTIGQLRQMITEVTGLFVDLASLKKFVHGNLDPRSVFIETVECEQKSFLRVRVDTSEHHMLTKLLKTVAPEVETQEETTSEELAKICAFEEFRRRQDKINEQSDVQALGQLILLLMKHTDFSGVDSSLSEKISDLVQNCSFTFKTWQQVLTHSVLQQGIQESDNQVIEPLKEGLAGINKDHGALEYSMLNMMPLQESTILDDPEAPEQFADIPACMDGEEESKEYASDSQQNVTSATLCDDLEQLLETGYAELIRTGIADAQDDNDSPMSIVLDESPFPKGMAVFDDDADVDEDSPFQNEDEFENGYEVICAREIVQIPVFPGGQPQPPQTMIVQGASYMMGKASKILGSLFTK